MNADKNVKDNQASNGLRALTYGDSPATPLLLTVSEVASLLRTSVKAVYALVERGQLDGVTRIGRRLLFRRDLLLNWVCQKSTSSLEAKR
jgi:excisionase family DNA binding protein